MADKLLIIFAMFLALLSGESSLAGELYTWEDAQGNLHITDERPSDGIEILSIEQVKTRSPDEMQQEMLKARLRAEEQAQARQRAAAEARKQAVATKESAKARPPEDKKQATDKYGAKSRNETKRKGNY